MDVDDQNNDADVQSDSNGSSDDDQLDDEKQQLLIKELQKQVKDCPGYYDPHIALIKALRDSGELLEARQAREDMNKMFPFSQELWLEWIKDERGVSSTDEEKAAVSALLQRATTECASVEVWTEYLLHTVGGGDITATRDVMEQALAAVGTNVNDGNLLWQAVFMVEMQVYASMGGGTEESDESKTPEQQQHINRLKALTKRRFRVPLLNMSEAPMLEEASMWFEGDVEPYMQQELKTTINKLNKLEPFEKELLQTEDNLWANLLSFEKYLAHLRKKEGPTQLQNLYERAVMKHAQSASMWSQYVSWCVDQFGGESCLLPPITLRAVRHCPWSGDLCTQHVRALQRSYFGDLVDLHEQVKGVVERCLTSLDGVEETVLLEEASVMWLCYLEYMARCFNWADEQKCLTQLIRFRETAKRAIDMLRSLQTGPGGSNISIPGDDKDVSVCRLLAVVEAKAGKLEAARAVWNDVMAQSGYTGRHDLWLEFIALERRVGTVKHCRKLYRRAMERVWDNVEAVAAEYKMFEITEGDVDSVNDLFKRCRSRMSIVLKRRADIKVKEDVIAEQTKANRKAKQKEKTKQKQTTNTPQGPAAHKSQNTGDWSSKANDNRNEEDSQNGDITYKKNKEQSPVKSSIEKDGTGSRNGEGCSTHTSAPNTAVATSGNVTDQGDVAPPPGYPGKRALDEPTTQAPAKKLKVTGDDAIVQEAMEITPKNVASGQESRTVFVSNLNYTTSVDAISAVFNNCGAVKEARLVKDFKGRSKGFGFVVFEKLESMHKALQCDRTAIGNRPMFVSTYEPEKGGHQFKYSTGVEKDKLYIRGLPYSMSEKEVKEAFEVHAPVTEIRLVTHRNGYSKGSCYVKFSDAKTAEKVRQEMDQKELRGFTISVLISDPSAAKREVARQSKESPNFDTVVARKAKLAFVPRALATKIVPKTSTPEQSKSESQSEKEEKVDDIPNPKSNDDFRKMLLKK